MCLFAKQFPPACVCLGIKLDEQNVANDKEYNRM